MKWFIVLTCIFASFNLCYAQKLNTVYYGISTDSLHNGHLLEFTNDTTIEISSFPRHMSQQFKISLKYKKKGNVIQVYNPDVSREQSAALLNNRFQQFSETVFMRVSQKAIIDSSNRVIYVQYKDFEKKVHLTYLIDGVIYLQETGLPNSYGLITNNPEENRALNRKLAAISDSLHNYSIHVYKGLEAYNKFGYRSVFGVIELKKNHINN
jgi:hypothetical protein